MALEDEAITARMRPGMVSDCKGMERPTRALLKGFSYILCGVRGFASFALFDFSGFGRFEMTIPVWSREYAQKPSGGFCFEKQGNKTLQDDAAGSALANPSGSFGVRLDVWEHIALCLQQLWERHPSKTARKKGSSNPVSGLSDCGKCLDS